MKPVWSKEKDGEKPKYKERYLDAGVYSFTVNKAVWEASDRFVSEENQDGFYLNVWLDVVTNPNVPYRKRIFTKIGLDSPFRLNCLRESAGLETLAENEDFIAEDLVGKTLKAQVKVFTTNSGEKGNSITKFIPAKKSREDLAKEEDHIEEDTESFDESDVDAPF